MQETIREAKRFLDDFFPLEDENWTEIEVVDNETELTVFKERKLK